MADVMSMLQQAIEHYRPGGEFATVRGEQLKGRERLVTAGMESQLVGRGLAGTTVGAAIPAAVEQQVSAPWRTETEMMRGGRLMEAVTAKAGFMERAETRRSAEELARERMDLQRELQDISLSAQEKAVKQQRLHEIEMQERQWGQEQTTQMGYETPSAPSLLDAGGMGADAGVSTEMLEPAPESWFTRLGGGEGEGELSQTAYQEAKAAGKPWTYNYGTWLAAKRSGKAGM